MNFFDKLRTQKVLSFTLMLFTLSVGIVIGTLVNQGVKAAKSDNPAAPGCDPAGDSQPGGTVEFVQPDCQAGRAFGGQYFHRVPAESPGPLARQRRGRQVIPPAGRGSAGRRQHGRFSVPLLRQRRRYPRCRSAAGQALGSGVVVDRAGYILTNNHVVDKADRIQREVQSTIPWNTTPKWSAWTPPPIWR